MPTTSRQALYWISRRCARWFYREVVVASSQPFPTGPVLLVGNHPNDLPDIVFGLRASPRHVRYLATVSVVSNWFARKSYEAMDVIPVVRVRDARKMQARGHDVSALNHAAGRLVAEAFSASEVVGVFPQGGVRDVYEIADLRSGVADMVLKSVDDGILKQVMVQPFGLQYEDARRPRSDVLVVLGAPFCVSEWRAEQRARGLECGSVALSARMREALLAVTRNAPSWEAAEVRDELLAAVAASTAAASTAAAATAAASTVASSTVAAVPLLTHAAALAMPAERVARDHASPAPSAHARRLRHDSHLLARAVKDAGGMPTSARDHARLLSALGITAPDATPRWSRTLALTLPALLGWTIHAPVFGLIWKLAFRLSTSRADLVARAFVPGIQIVMVWYAVMGLSMGAVMASADYSPIWTVLLPMLFVAVSPRLADAAVDWVDAVRAHRLRWRVRHWSEARQDALRSTASALRAEWLSHHLAGADVATGHHKTAQTEQQVSA